MKIIKNFFYATCKDPQTRTLKIKKLIHIFFMQDNRFDHFYKPNMGRAETEVLSPRYRPLSKLRN